jgi:subtilisin family serine protease
VPSQFNLRNVPRSRRSLLKACRAAEPVLALAVLLLNSGCGGVGDTLKTSSTVLIKMPIKDPVEARSSGRWHFAHVLEAPKDPAHRGQWYAAWNDQQPLVTQRFVPFWSKLYDRGPEIADAAHAAFQEYHAYPVLIEPNNTYTQVVAKEPGKLLPGENIESRYGAGTRLVINQAALPSPAWSNDAQPDPKRPGQVVVDPMWYRDSRHSQLAQAQARFQRRGELPGDGITIGHLDNGLDGRHSAVPLRLVRGQWRADTTELRDYLYARSLGQHPPKPTPPEDTGGTHGMGTIGILAGGWVQIDEMPISGGRIKGYYGWLGGAPYATVVPVRVAPWVASLSTAELAYSIDYASRRQHCDILTMSHGGAPTLAWADAVNAAYERGTAMFAAESDFFSIVPEPFRPSGIILPASPVYPAAFARVLGVTGITADERSYARDTVPRLLHSLGSLKSLQDWIFRGSYGADGTSTVLYRPNRHADLEQRLALGDLRPYPIAAYSPNIPWLSYRLGADGQQYADGVDLNGAGTSAATPQVAAAAALWLQKYRSQIPAEVWSGKKDGWKKAEAVYYALLKSAHRKDGGPDPYLGAGALRANDALALSYRSIQKERRPASFQPAAAGQIPRGSLYYGMAPQDRFDGDRSFLGLLGLQSWQRVRPEDEADLRQRPDPGEDRRRAIQRLFYNMSLLQAWHGGSTPRKESETGLWERAGHRAGQVPN